MVDFTCLIKNLIIEVDGNQHLDNQEYDDNTLSGVRGRGWRVAPGEVSGRELR